jgi:hypothetical protein
VQHLSLWVQSWLMILLGTCSYVEHNSFWQRMLGTLMRKGLLTTESNG